MRKTLIFAAAMTLVASAAFAQITIANRNASGFELFWLEVPAGVNMVADTQSNDWAWFDPEFVMTNDEFSDEANLPSPTRDDLDVTVMMAWKGSPDNRWYVHMTIHDDTLRHFDPIIARWQGDMLGFGTNPTDGERDRGNGGLSMEWYAAPGDLSPNWAYRYPTGDAEPGILAWLEYGESPWLEFALDVDPPEAWNTLWGSDTGGQTIYEWNVVMITELLDGGPAASNVHDLDAVSGEDGAGTQFIFWVEDGDGDEASNGTFNDWTSRGDQASAEQFFSHALLLQVGEYTEQDQPTAVEATSWGRIKSSF